jgi:uncharacterized protein (TIGR02145 family)
MKKNLTFGTLLIISMLLSIAFAPGCGKEEVEDGTIKDYDGNVYKTVQIGTQTWMASNLMVTNFNDGTMIKLEENNDLWKQLSVPGYCWYGNNSEQIRKDYGALYNFHAAASDKLCPKGWRVPTLHDYYELSMHLGGESVAGGKMKETGMVFWESPNTDATNETGFNGRGGGFRSHTCTGGFGNLKLFGYWWTSSEHNATTAYLRALNHDNPYLGASITNKQVGCSVRCIKN